MHISNHKNYITAKILYACRKSTFSSPFITLDKHTSNKHNNTEDPTSSLQSKHINKPFSNSIIYVSNTSLHQRYSSFTLCWTSDPFLASPFVTNCIYHTLLNSDPLTLLYNSISHNIFINSPALSFTLLHFKISPQSTAELFISHFIASL